MPRDSDRRNDDTKEEQHNNDKWQNIQMKIKPREVQEEEQVREEEQQQANYSMT